MTQAIDNIGPHLLGRVPSVPDARNYRLADYLGAPVGTADPLVALNTAVQTSWEGRKTKVWIAEATRRLVAVVPPAPTPGPTPAPTPPSAPTSWIDADDPVLDQGQTPRCVGFTGADWENALPTDDHVDNTMGDDIYAACKGVDGDTQDGSTIHSLATVLRQRGKLTTYAFASTIAEVEAFVASHGPICWGIGWTDSMFTPDANGLVVPSGDDVGGHAIIEYEYDPTNDLHWLLNHWGDQWGLSGRFCMRGADLAVRLANGGEALAAVELP